MTDQPGRPSGIRSLGGTRPLGDEGGAWAPPVIETIEDTGLNLLYVSDLVLKVLYYGGVMAGHVIAEVVKLPYTGVLDTAMEFLKREKYVEVRGATTGFGEAAFQYVITLKGSEKAREAMERSQYAGPAPVPLRQYIESVHGQNQRKLIVHQEDLRRIMTNLIISDEMLSRIGPAVNSGRSIFLYGPPGNGKTTVSEKIGRMILGDDIWIPYAIDVDGQIVQVYDSVNHELSEQEGRLKAGTGKVRDVRWVRIKRPMIMVGGELTMAGLDLVWNDVNKFYEAPYQVKANGGMFLIDDFGRQQVRPKDLLNRWIVPLEKGVDFLTLNNGRKIEVPFFVLIVFSTNLDPKDLVDEAFLRRIRYKIEIGNPTYEQFREVFKLMCRLLKVPYDEQGLAYLLNEWYVKQDRDLRFVHPRDLLSQIIDISTYLNRPPTLTKDLIDRACTSYFVEL